MLRNRHSFLQFILLITTLGACSSSSKAFPPEAGVDGILSSDPVSAYDSGTKAAQVPDAPVALDVQPQDSYMVDIQVDASCVDVDCSAGYSRNANNTCEPILSCNGSPLLGCACGSPGDTACNAAVRPSKVPLVCQGGLWILNGGSCSLTQNCDWKDGLCKPIVSACAGLNPGDAFCDYSLGVTVYKDVRMVCGDDLVDVTAADNPCVGTCGGDPAVCQTAACGDGKVEIGEACDDGNTVPLDGCEPSICEKSKVLKLALGDGHSCALCHGGYVRCWGVNTTNGELGIGHLGYEENKNPYQITDKGGNPGAYVDLGGVAVTDISAGIGFTCALLTGGSVRCWGRNDKGQLGPGTTTTIPPQIGAAINFGIGVTASAISASADYACALLSNGTIQCWGDNTFGMLGLGNTNPVHQGTVALATTPAPIAVSAGMGNACALLSGGAVHCWGDNYYGEFGLGNSKMLSDSTSTPPSAYGSAALVSTATSVSVGGAFNCARLSDGSAECWGANDSGQLGIGNTTTIGNVSVPSNAGTVQLGSTTVASIIASDNFACALLADNGGLKCWGNNSLGQLGQGNMKELGDNSGTVPISNLPIKFPTGMSVTSVYLGNSYACALMNDSANITYVRCWGANGHGQLGLGKVSASIGGASTETPDQLPAVMVLPP